MPQKTNTSKFDLENNLEEKFIAYLDVMGFKELVFSGSVKNLDSYFSKITDELDSIKNENPKIQSLLISDSIILIAPEGLRSLKQLISTIRRIQSALIWRKILLRGAISHGEVYYNEEKNVIVGKGYIKAYLLEQEAKFPRVILDPSIIKKVSDDKVGFLKLLNDSLEYNFEDRLIYTESPFTKIYEDGIFIDYANKTIKSKELNGNINKIYQTIIENLYTDQKLYSKYVWLRDYYLESLKLTNSLIKGDSRAEGFHKKNLENWIQKFERL